MAQKRRTAVIILLLAIIFVGLFQLSAAVAQEYNPSPFDYNQPKYRPSAPEPGYGTNNGNDSIIVSFFGLLGWLLGWVLFSWLTPVLVVYLLYCYRANIAARYNVWRAKSSSKNTAAQSADGLTESKITFADVALPEELLEEISEIADFLKNPADLTHFGVRPPKGVLLSGPPGCGKTMIARAIAGEAGVRFYAYCGSDFVNMYVGVGAASIRQRFAEAKAHTPCIVFIDELDSLGSKRGEISTGGDREYDHALNQLLSEIDGFQRTPGLVLLSATNREDLLDPALLRAGRFDRKVYVDAPDLSMRESILKIHSKNKAIDSSVDMKLLARTTAGFSGADLENVLNEAAIIAYRRWKKSILNLPLIKNLLDRGTIERRDLEEARQKIIAGLGRKSAYTTDEEKLICAFHEAGHVLVAKKILGAKDPIDVVSIIPRGRSLGITVQVPEFDRRIFPRDYLLNKISILYGGRLAEELKFGGEHVTTGAANDIQQAVGLARRMTVEWGMSDLGPTVFQNPDGAWWQRYFSERQSQEIDAAAERIIKNQIEAAKVILGAHRMDLELLACALIVKETLTDAEIDVFLNKGEAVAEEMVSALMAEGEKKGGFSKYFNFLKG